MADFTQTVMDAYIPQVWSKKATITYRSNVVLANLCDRRWEPEISVGKGDRVNIPNFSQNSAAKKRSTFGTGAAVTFDAVDEALTTFQVDQFAYKAFRVPAELSVQAMAMYEPLLVRGIGEAIALQIDNELASDTSNGVDSFSTVVGTLNIDITDDNILTCETNLNNANAPVSDRFMVVSPATRTSLMKIDAYRNQLYTSTVGSVPGDRAHGYLGRIYTFDVYMSNNLAGAGGKKNGAFQREAVAFVMQKDVTIIRQTNIADGLFNEVVGYAVYGFKKIKDSFGNELDGK
ncbi:MAG: hypothetical protein FJ317_07310 [SAR202 cluster bacterium]|nr:hypothetical protein [SAR202 cluster bacterium]